MQAIDILVEPSELEKYLRTGAVLLDTRRPTEFKKGHIPGALPFSTYAEFVPDTTLEGMKKFADAMAGRFASVGVTHEKNVIVYDDHTGERAARELWILEYLGHQRAHMLHGG